MRHPASWITLVMLAGTLGACRTTPPAASLEVPRFALTTVVTDLDAPRGLALTADGAYVATRRGVVLVGPEGAAQSVASASGLLLAPTGVAVATGAVFIADPGSHRVWRQLADGAPEPFAGTGTSLLPIGDGGLAVSAQLDRPVAVALTPGGHVLILDAGQQRLRQVDPDGRITTVAGNGQTRYAGDGQPAREASFHDPEAFAVAPDGTIYLADTGHHALRRIAPTGEVSTVAGNGKPGLAEEGAMAGHSPLASPSGVVPFGAGVLLAEAGNHRIRYLGPDGRLTTVAGTGAVGRTDEAADATQGALDTPGALALAPDGTPFFVDRGTGRLYQLRPAATASAAP